MVLAKEDYCSSGAGEVWRGAKRGGAEGALGAETKLAPVEVVGSWGLGIALWDGGDSELDLGRMGKG